MIPRDNSVKGLANALYDGTVTNLAETLARMHGQAGALSFLDMMGSDVQNFWFLVAQLLVQQAKDWDPNDGSCCVLSDAGQRFLESLPRWKEGMRFTITEENRSPCHDCLLEHAAAGDEIVKELAVELEQA